MPLLRGRDFQPSDTQSTRRVALIDDVLARRYFANADPIGRQIAVGFQGTADVVAIGPPSAD